MKSKRLILIALAAILAVPFFSGCKRGANDPWFSLKSRNSRISAVWTLESGYYDWLYQYEEELRYLDDDCEDVPNNLPEYKDLWTYTKSFNFSDALAHYEQEYTTTIDLIDIGTDDLPFIVEGKELEDARTIKRDINFNYELTIKKNGTYRLYITYNVFEDDFPQIDAPDGDPQSGLTFSGTFAYEDEWHWTDNSLGTREGIQFDGFAFPEITITPKWDILNAFENNYIGGIGFRNTDIIFEIDRLASKELTLMSTGQENGFYQKVDNEYEATTNGGAVIDCESTFTITTLESEEYHLQWISDGKSVDE